MNPVVTAVFNPVILIETYWNVNRDERAAEFYVSNINRDILECKCKTKKGCFKPHFILIETYWNVNF